MDTIAHKIEQVLEERVRPQLHLHGGDIESLSLENGVYRFRLLGQCANCPSAHTETEEMIREALLSGVPELREVVMEQFVSDELLAYAKRLLHHE